MSIRTIPALTNHNPGRPGWTIEAEAASLADAGASGLAGSILRSGFSPAEPVAVADNIDRVSLAGLFAAILAGLDSRKNKDGTSKLLILATDPEGKAVKVDLDKVRTTIAGLDPQDVRPDYAIPAGGDGRRRTVAYALAMVYAMATARTIGPMHVVACATDKGSDALAGNLRKAYSRALGPWQKVIAAVEVLRERPTMTESDLMQATEAKRGDAQLMHRAASAIIRHRLTVDPAGRCPGKEEWIGIRDMADSDAAQDALAKAIASTRPKSVGVDAWQRALANLPSDVSIPARALATAMEVGTEEALAALVSPLMK